MEHFHIVVHQELTGLVVCIMFLWLCAVIALVSAANLENDEISQRLGDILRGSSESDDQKMDGHWYQIANFQVNEDQNECKHLIITENITKFLDENCKETLSHSTSQKNEFKLIKTSSGDFLAVINKNKETQTDSLALYGSNVDPKQLQQQLPKSLGDLLLKPCDKIYKDCMRKVRNAKDKCENMKKSLRKADTQAQMDYMDDYFTICTMNNTDYISYDDVFIPIEPSIKDSDKENPQTPISNKIEKDDNPERFPLEHVKQLANDPFLSENDKTTNHQNISLEKDEYKNTGTAKMNDTLERFEKIASNRPPQEEHVKELADDPSLSENDETANHKNISLSENKYKSANTKMNDTSEHFEKITSNRPPKEYVKEVGDDPSSSENDETANHKNISLGENEYKNSTTTKMNDTSEGFEKITSNKLKPFNITDDSSVNAGNRMFDMWNRGLQKSTLDEKKEEDESNFFNSGGSSELSVKRVTNHLDGLLNKVNKIVEKAKVLSNLAREKAYNANGNSINSQLNKNIVPSKNPDAKVRESNLQSRKALSRDYLFVTTPHSADNRKWIQSQTSISFDSNDEGSGDYESRNQATSTDSSLFEKYSKVYESFRNSNTKDSAAMITTTKIVEKQNLTYSKANENNTNKDDSSGMKLPYDDFGEYLPTISHSSSENNDNQQILYPSESSDLENATPFEFDISNISITTTDASDSSSGDTIITKNFNVLNITNTTYNGIYGVTSMPTTQIPNVHHSSSMSQIINPALVVVMMLINFLNDG